MAPRAQLQPEEKMWQGAWKISSSKGYPYHNIVPFVLAAFGYHPLNFIQGKKEKHEQLHIAIHDCWVSIRSVLQNSMSKQQLRATQQLT